MSFNDIIKYFSSEEYKQNLKSEYSHSVPLAKGCEKTVRITADNDSNSSHQTTHLVKPIIKKVFLCIPPTAENVEKFEVEYSKNLEINLEMIKDGINVVQIFGYFKQDGEYVEVQEQAPGNVVHFLSKKNVETQLLTTEEKGLPKDEKTALVKQRQQEYNLKMQQELLDAPQELYDKFLADAKLLMLKYNQPLIDVSNSENVTFSPEKGFFFIDLEPYSNLSLTAKNKPATDMELIKTISWLFSNIDAYYTGLEDDKVYFAHKRANKTIITKFANAIINNHFDLTKENLQAVERIIIDRCSKLDGPEVAEDFKRQYMAKVKNFNQ